MKTLALLLAALALLGSARPARASNLDACLAEYRKWTALGKEDYKTPEYKKKYEEIEAAVAAKGCPKWRDVQNCKDLKREAHDPRGSLVAMDRYHKWNCSKWVTMSEPPKPGVTPVDPACAGLRRQLMQLALDGGIRGDMGRGDPIRAEMRAKKCPAL